MECDHIIPFKRLMRDYLETQGHYPELFLYAHSGWAFRPEDREFEAGWAKFHEERCQLRMLCERCHLKVTLEARMARPIIRYFGDSDSSEEALIQQMSEVAIESENR